MNAKQELLGILEGKSGIKCADLQYDDNTNYFLRENIINKFFLEPIHNEKDEEDFLNSLDFEYDSGYGTQELEGVVWLVDGTWLERGEYDGAEWWEHKVVPIFPYFKTNQP